jgi:hypothetical protein
MYSSISIYVVPKENVEQFLRVQRETLAIYQEEGCLDEVTFAPVDLRAKYGEDYARVIKLYFEQIAERPVAERQIGVRPGHELADQPGPEHQPMAGHLGIGRDLFHGGDECL